MVETTLHRAGRQNDASRKPLADATPAGGRRAAMSGTQIRLLALAAAAQVHGKDLDCGDARFPARNQHSCRQRQSGVPVNWDTQLSADFGAIPTVAALLHRQTFSS
jgi:hypothetical protein